jgi:predicted aconitase
MASELDYGLVGYFAGKTVKESSVAIPGIHPTRQQAKALAGAIGTSGSCGMFTTGDAAEKVSFGKKEAQAMMDELGTADDGDVIAFGSPQLGIDELEMLAGMVQGKKFRKRCMIFCSRAIHNQASKIGLTGAIEKAGGQFMCDSCTCLTPYISKDEVDSVVTNSIKGAYYLNHSNKVKVALKDMKAIVKEYAK